MHSKSRHIARAKKRTRKACTANQNPKKVRRRELFFLARRPSESVSAFARVSFLLRSVARQRVLSLLKEWDLDVTFARSEDDREGIFRCRLPDVGSSSTPNASAGCAVHSSRRAHSLGSSRSRPRKTRIFSFFFFLECALSLSSLVFFFFFVVVFQLKHAVEEENRKKKKTPKTTTTTTMRANDDEPNDAVLWQIVTDHPDIFDNHIVPKLNGNDVKFFYDVNSESRMAIKRSGVFG